ncbi:hypothetical protein GE061_007120 [Apolygus lucorum]|uniref:Peptidase S1 domain-containing protein n=1 Tax=Apolygus lucorum TaxID=248454 RepID=A0A8S9WUP4_APOLU|nr:hypothetical protein GE061_007120 [Apolygus lucorum]
MKCFIVCVLVTCLGFSSARQVGKQKRIVFGSPLLSTTAYDVVGFFVRIDQPFVLFTALRYFLKPSPGSNVCGGAALTPHIVQTACHCLNADWTPPLNGPYRFPTLKNGWENMFVLHHGHFSEETMTDGVWSRKFLVHEQCYKHKRSGFISNDFGLILTRGPLRESTNHAVKHSFAPVYTETEIALQYHRIMKNEAICLFVGFGPYRFEEKKPLAVFGEQSPLLQHGWRALINYWNCYRESGYYRYEKDTDYNKVFTFPNVNYTRDCTWGCSIYFGKFRALAAQGDSGGPVTCDGVYFGVVSTGYSDIYTYTPKVWQQDNLLAYAMFENAAEYRELMNVRLWHYWGNNDDKPPAVPDRATINPFVRPTTTEKPTTESNEHAPFYWELSSFDQSYSKCSCTLPFSSTFITVLILIFIRPDFTSSSSIKSD